MSQINGAGQIERWDSAESPAPLFRSRIERPVATGGASLESGIDFLPATSADLHLAHSEDLASQLKVWAAELDAREAVLNAREAMIDHRERTVRIWAADMKRAAEEQELAKRSRGEVLGKVLMDARNF